MSRIVAVLCLLLAIWTVSPAQAAVGPLTGYLMAHFTGESATGDRRPATGEQIYLAQAAPRWPSGRAPTW